MVCPVCGNFLVTDVMGDNYFCHNPDCVMYHVSMSQKQWRPLIQTKQDLEITKKGLNKVITKTNSQVVRGFEYIATGIVKVAKDTLKRIEHKDNK